uniref:Uncharacterized protein n=1 Tax=Micrurus spixii TaxID=129469 RepID=A0A2D4MJN9_9SAUR
MQQAVHLSSTVRGSREIEGLVKVTGPKDNAKMARRITIQIAIEMGLGTNPTTSPDHPLEIQTTSTRLALLESMELGLGLSQAYQPRPYRHIWSHSAQKPRLCHRGNLDQASMRHPIPEDHKLCHFPKLENKIVGTFS